MGLYLPQGSTGSLNAKGYPMEVFATYPGAAPRISAIITLVLHAVLRLNCPTGSVCVSGVFQVSNNRATEVAHLGTALPKCALQVTLAWPVAPLQIV